MDQDLAGQNAAIGDNVFAHKLWASRGAELLDKIGPAIIQVHSAGGPFGWIVANERPTLVKAIVNVEGGGAPFGNGNPWGSRQSRWRYDPPVADSSQLTSRDVTGSNGQTYKLQADPARKLKNLLGIPIVYVVAEKSGRSGEPTVAFPEAGRMRRRSDEPEGQRDPRQRALHDAGEQPPTGIRCDSKLDRSETAGQNVEFTSFRAVPNSDSQIVEAERLLQKVRSFIQTVCRSIGAGEVPDRNRHFKCG